MLALVLLDRRKVDMNDVVNDVDGVLVFDPEFDVPCGRETNDDSIL